MFSLLQLNFEKCRRFILTTGVAVLFRECDNQGTFGVTSFSGNLGILTEMAQYKIHIGAKAFRGIKTMQRLHTFPLLDV